MDLQNVGPFVQAACDYVLLTSTVAPLKFKNG